MLSLCLEALLKALVLVGLCLCVCVQDYLHSKAIHRWLTVLFFITLDEFFLFLALLQKWQKCTFCLFVYLFMTSLGLHCLSWAFSGCGELGRLSCCRRQAPLWWYKGLVAPRHVGSSWIRDPTCVPFIGRWILNHRVTREVLHFCLSFSSGLRKRAFTFSHQAY